MNCLFWFSGLVTMVMLRCNAADLPDICYTSNITRLSITDTAPRSTPFAKVLNSSYTVERISCSLDATEYLENLVDITSNSSEISLLKDAWTICNPQFDCQVTCRTDNEPLSTFNSRIIVTINRTMTYNITFEDQHFNSSVTEGSPNGTHVTIEPKLNLKALSCPNHNFDNQQYGLSQTNLPFFWQSQTSHDSLRVGGLIDYEMNTSFQIEILGSISINTDKPSTATATIYVTVEDIDDNKPEFSIPSIEQYVLKINEEEDFTEPLTAEPPILAFDPDKGLNKTILYNLTETDGGPFTIDEDNGNITVKGKLDFETKSNYRVIVKAYQEDQPATRTALATLLVNVIDVDDHKPEFNIPSYTSNIVEHSIEGTLVCRVEAIDKDTTPEFNNFTYIVSGGSGVFTIGDYSGEIRVTNSTQLDREIIGDTLTIQVMTNTLNGTYGDTTTVNINVLDINDNNPVFTEGGTYTFNLDITSNVIGTVNATDLDSGVNGEIEYDILTAPIVSDCMASHTAGNNPFHINTTTGEITLIGATLVCKYYKIIIQACDSGLNRRCTIGSVEVHNDHAGELQNRTQTLEVQEGGAINTYIGLVECSDKGRVYNYSGPEEFRIDNATGMVVTADELDREERDFYNFLVTVSSSGTLLCNVNVTVLVGDINDNPPIFDQSYYHFKLTSTAAVGDVIGTIQATDGDIGDNSNISYTLKDSPFVEISELSGSVSIKHENIGRVDILRVYVVAMDNGVPPLQNSVPIYISGQSEDNTIPISTPMSVTDVNDGKAKLAGLISEILNINVQITKVTTISAQDSTYQSKVYIKPSANKRKKRAVDDNEQFLSAVVSQYEDIKNVFYQPSTQYVTDDDETAGLGAPTIGLIAMAGVILIGTIAAIIIIQRQFNSQKRYRQLYETMTKNSSMYESQELKMDVEDEVSNVGNRSVKDEDFGKTSTPPSPDLAVSAHNPMYTGDDSNVDLNGSIGQNETTDINNALRELTDSYEQEEGIPGENHGENHGENEDNSSSPVVYANVHKTDDGGDVVFVVDVEPEIVDDQENVIQHDNSELMHFDSKISGEVQNAGDIDGNNDNVPDNEDAEDEPNPDYEIKQVRFHSEVLDAGENKIEPLKIKSEEVATSGTESTDVDSENTDVADKVDGLDEDTETDHTEGSTTNISHTSGYNSDNPSFKDNDIDTPMAEDGDQERLEEEIDAPSKEQFYFSNIESTHF